MPVPPHAHTQEGNPHVFTSYINAELKHQKRHGGGGGDVSRSSLETYFAEALGLDPTNKHIGLEVGQLCLWF